MLSSGKRAASEQPLATSRCFPFPYADSQPMDKAVVIYHRRRFESVVGD